MKLIEIVRNGMNRFPVPPQDEHKYPNLIELTLTEDEYRELIRLVSTGATTP